MSEPAPVASLPTTAFADIVSETQAPLTGFVRGLLEDAEEACDVVQEVFIDAWRTLEKMAHPFTQGDEAVARRRAELRIVRLGIQQRAIVDNLLIFRYMAL